MEDGLGSRPKCGQGHGGVGDRGPVVGERGLGEVLGLGGEDDGGAVGVAVVDT